MPLEFSSTKDLRGEEAAGFHLKDLEYAYAVCIPFPVKQWMMLRLQALVYNDNCLPTVTGNGTNPICSV